MNKKNKTKKFTKLKPGFIFLGLFLLYFIFIYVILNYSFLYKYINSFFGITSNFVITYLFGIPASLSIDPVTFSSVITISSIDYPVFINGLCTGILEFSILVCAILATRLGSLKKRLLWCSIALGVVVIFNITRISLTVFLITKLNQTTASFFHGFLFRLFLVLVVIGTYWLFLRSVNPKHNKKK